MTDCDILQSDVLSCLMTPFRLMRKGVLLGLRRLPLITDSYCSPRQPPTPCHSKAFRFLCASVLIVFALHACLLDGSFDCLWIPLSAMPDAFRIVGASSSYPLFCIVRSFIQSGVRVLLAAASSATEMLRLVP